MKCRACASKLEDSTLGRCPVCGFPLIHMVGEGETQEETLDKLSREYREMKLGAVRLGYLTYSHRMKEGRLIQDAVHERSFSVRACDLPLGETVWEEKDFARIESGEEITLTLVIEEDGVKRKRELRMLAPDSEGLWHVGLMAEPGFAVRIAVGDGKSGGCSEAVPLLSERAEHMREGGAGGQKE